MIHCVLHHIPTLRGPMGCSQEARSSVHRIFQARILEWVAMPSSGDLPDPGIKPMSLESPALAGRLFTTEPPGEPILMTAILNSLWDNSKIEDKC